MPSGQRLLIALSAIAMALLMILLLTELAADGRLTTLLDEPWPRPAYRIAGSAAILCAAPTMLLAVYYFLSTIAEIKPEKRVLVQFIAPIAFFLPQLWTEKGNRYRKLFLLWIGIFGSLAAVAAMAKALLG